MPGQHISPLRNCADCSYYGYMSTKPTNIRLKADQPERVERLAAITIRSRHSLMLWALELGLRQLETEHLAPEERPVYDAQDQ